MRTNNKKIFAIVFILFIMNSCMPRPPGSKCPGGALLYDSIPPSVYGNDPTSDNGIESWESCTNEKGQLKVYHSTPFGSWFG